MPDRMNQEASRVSLNVEDASRGLPVDRFIPDWTVDKKRPICLNDQQTFAGVKRGACSANVMYGAYARDYEGSSVGESLLNQFSGFH